MYLLKAPLCYRKPENGIKGVGKMIDKPKVIDGYIGIRSMLGAV